MTETLRQKEIIRAQSGVRGTKAEFCREREALMGGVGRGGIYWRRPLRSIRKGIKSIDPIGRQETKGGGEYTAGEEMYDRKEFWIWKKKSAVKWKCSDSILKNNYRNVKTLQEKSCF